MEYMEDSNQTIETLQPNDEMDILNRIPDDLFDHIDIESKKFIDTQRKTYIDSKFRKITHRQRKSYTAEVITHARRLELKTYELCIKWKKTFRYDLIADFRKTVSSIRRHLIYGYGINKKFCDEKLFQYNLAQTEIDELESIMWLMIQPSINIMSSVQWAEIAYEVDTINSMLEKLISSLKYKEPESNGCDH